MDPRQQSAITAQEGVQGSGIELQFPTVANDEAPRAGGMDRRSSGSNFPMPVSCAHSAAASSPAPPALASSPATSEQEKHGQPRPSDDGLPHSADGRTAVGQGAQLADVMRSPATKHFAPRKNASGLGRYGNEPTSRELDPETMSMSSVAISDGTSSNNTDLDSVMQYNAAMQAAQAAARRPPDRHASMPTIAQGSVKMMSNPPHRTASMSSSTGPMVQGTSLSSAGPSMSGSNAAPHSISSAGGAEGEHLPPAKVRPPVKATPSRLGIGHAAIMQRASMDVGSEMFADGHSSISTTSIRMTMGSSQSLATLQKTVEQLMLQDNEVFQKVQSSMRGISSLAKETTNLEVGRDATGATCINQYVVVKTLGRGSFGKVKLCLNTLDGNLYAIKMVNRSFIVKQLQKPTKGLRRRLPTRNASGGTIASSQASPSPTSGVPRGPTSAGATISPLVSPSAIEAPQLGFMKRVAETGTSLASSRVLNTEETANPLDSVMREIAVLKKMDHPNVVKLHEVIDPPSASYMMLVMEYMERGPVLETKGQTGFNSFPERIARDYFRQACAGLDYLHYNNVVHGDLKPENLLVTASGQLKIGDFGSARMMGDASTSSKVSCTPAFQPPEALTNPGCEDPHSADVWALGVCLFCFIYGRLPFTGSCLLDISNAIRNDELQFPPDVPISADLKDLLTRVLDKDPQQRITLDGMMNHPWVSERGNAPLPTLKVLLAPKVEVTRVEAQSAIDRASMVSMIRARLKEKTCAPGEWLFKEGDEAHCIFMIMSGVVEITTRLNGKQVDTSVVDAMEEQSFSVDMDESFTLDCSNLVPEGLNVKDGRLHIDREKAQALKDRMRGILLGRQAEYVTEVKGPGQVIGDVGMDKTATARHQHSARARDTVTVVKLTEESFLKALMQQAAEVAAVADNPSLLMTEDQNIFSARNVDDDGTGFGSAGLTTILDTADVDINTL